MPSPIARSPARPRIDLGLAILRATAGAVFIAHGAQKLFTWGFAGVTGGFEQMGIPLAPVVAPAVALVEFFGGLALVLGLFTRVAGVGLAAVMLGAMSFVHLKAGFFLPDGYEFALTLFAAAVTLALTGSGAYSLDALRSGFDATSRPAYFEDGAADHRGARRQPVAAVQRD